MVTPVHKAQDVIQHLAAGQGIQARGKIVEKEKIGTGGYRQGEKEAALHSFRELADLLRA